MKPRTRADAVTRVMLVDQALVRAAVRQALDVPDIAIVAEVSSGEEAMPLAIDRQPDVLLLDLDLPGMTGLELIRELSPRLPRTQIVVLTRSGSQQDALDAVRFGAAGFLTKELAPDALLRAVRGLRQGDLAMSRRLAASVLATLARRPRSATGDAAGSSSPLLTARESEILRLVADGLSDREVADVLRISIRTVETHVSNLLRKLGARNRAEAARMHRERS